MLKDSCSERPGGFHWSHVEQLAGKVPLKCSISYHDAGRKQVGFFLYFNQIALTTFFFFFFAKVWNWFFFFLVHCCFFPRASLTNSPLATTTTKKKGGRISQTINHSSRHKEGAGIIKSKMIWLHKSKWIVRIVKVFLMFDSTECSEAALSNSQTLGSVCVGWEGR